jgi:RNA polymerase sigma-70 factor (ECF subfamily)
MPQMDFPSTHWTLLMQARGTENRAREAIQQLCSSYWYPLFAFARLSLRVTSEEAEDLTQSFFEHALRSRLFARVQQNSGNFRNYLLVCFRNFHASAVKRVRAARREGTYELVSIYREGAERRLALHRADETAERTYDKAWAFEVLNHAYRRTEIHYSAQGKLDLFRVLRVFLENPMARPYSEVAATIGKSEAAVKTEVYRLRRVFSEAFRSIVAESVCAHSEVEAEVRYLVGLLSE